MISNARAFVHVYVCFAGAEHVRAYVRACVRACVCFSELAAPNPTFPPFFFSFLLFVYVAKQ